ncbi:TIGR03790 family protein [Candidatus Uabimicrobium sp. HlEnr_7]|uniref:TIGR03790 family protein n=1 Tax=Candidatus Uabimicrobium helgolandensis TaxID=3095367 RepID=UPI00355753D3
MCKVLLMLSSLCCLAYCGGGAQNVAIVVNQNSWSSLTIANTFIFERQIPKQNVIYIDYQKNIEEISVENFRQQILLPVIQTLQKRGVAAHIDYIVYSSDFPWRVRFDKDFPQIPKTFGHLGSITGLTYLYQLVMSKAPYHALYSNWYFRATSFPTHGFRSYYAWNRNGSMFKDPRKGPRYILSTMLGVTTGRGNSVEEIVHLLQESRKTDGKQPKGTFYFHRNNNVRSTTRHKVFPEVCKALGKIGKIGEVISGIIPQNKNDILGSVVGTANFNWKQANNTIIPGAICEHLTSFGGRLEEFSGQTPISEFLRHGATGSSGTVMEPYAIQAKFPTPWLHVYYASGCSLAEAFYQSVQGPYQLLILGDPLCQPWAKFPQIRVTGIKKYQKISGTVMLNIEKSNNIAHYSIFVDGRLLARTIEPQLQFNSETLNDGFHEMRVVAITSSDIEEQGSFIIPFYVYNNKHWTKFKKLRRKEFHWGENIDLKVGSNHGNDVVLFHNNRQIAAAKKGEKFFLNTQMLGTGNINLQAASIRGKDYVFSKPLALKILPPVKIACLSKLPTTKKTKGIRIVTPAKTHIVKAITKRGRTAYKIVKNTSFSLQTYIEINSSGIYQLQLLSGGAFVFSINDNKLVSTRSGVWSNIPLHLEKGIYKFDFSGETNGGQIDVRFGQRGAYSLSKKQCFVY